MTIATRDQPDTKITLTRTRVNTIAWMLRTAATPTRPAHGASTAKARAARQADKAPIALIRTRADTVRWVMRATPFGILAILLTVAAAVGAIAGLWALVPTIDAAVAVTLTAIGDAVTGFLEWLNAFPGWLESLT